jgi:hypothetical protein
VPTRCSTCPKYGITPEQIAHNQATIRERGAAVGFRFGARPRVWNTFDAHRLLHWAGLQGRQRELKHALLNAYHGEGRNPGAHDVLLELAAQVGLDVDAARAVLADGAYTDEVRASEAFWQQAGIHSVPSVIVDDLHLIQGGRHRRCSSRPCDGRGRALRSARPMSLLQVTDLARHAANRAWPGRRCARCRSRSTVDRRLIGESGCGKSITARR